MMNKIKNLEDRQKDLLLENKTVLDNVILPLLIRKVSKKEATEQATQILKEFGLFDVADKYPHELSGGDGDWAVFDNFRLTYFGKHVSQGTITGIDTIKNNAVEDGKIYNLQGMEVKRPLKSGIYIRKLRDRKSVCRERV